MQMAQILRHFRFASSPVASGYPEFSVITKSDVAPIMLVLRWWRGFQENDLGRQIDLESVGIHCESGQSVARSICRRLRASIALTRLEHVDESIRLEVWVWPNRLQTTFSVVAHSTPKVGNDEIVVGVVRVFKYINLSKL